MLDRSPFLQFLGPRLGRLHRDLPGKIWRRDARPLAVTATTPTREHRPIAQAEQLVYQPVEQPHHWGEMFDQRFWRIDLRGRETQGRYLLWADQAEATVFTDGVPRFGFDPGHKYHPVPQDAQTLLVESVCARTGIWVPNVTPGLSPRGSLFEGAYLVERDDAAWSLYHDVDVLMQLATLLIARDTHADDPMGWANYRIPFDTAEPLAKRIVSELDRACQRFEAGDVAGAAELSGALVEELSGRGDPVVSLVLTGHAHIDLVWLWPENVGEFKAVHSFANVLSLMDRYPELVFGYSQPASYDAIDRRAPKLMEAVGQRVREGRFEHAGATYVESDTQLPCGESLLRSFEVGQAEVEARFGRPSDVLWIPDVFGYSPCIPQIMKALGVDYFYTTKQHWSLGTQFPYSSFRWRGHDGSEVLAHVSWSHYNQDATPQSHRFFASRHRQAGVHAEALLPTGYGDGGGGPTPEMLERARRMSDLAGLPRAKWGRIDEFFARLAPSAGELPVWQGEIYLETHRGVQAVRSHLKNAYRAAEKGLQAWEAVRAARGAGELDRNVWKRLIFTQFHDYLPGTSIERVYDEGIPELQRIAADATQEASDELAAVGSSPAAGTLCLFNPLAVRQACRVDDWIVMLPPLTGAPVAKLDRVAGRVRASQTRLSNDRLTVTFDERGEVASLCIDGQDIALAAPLAQIWTFPERPVAFDAWDIDRFTLSSGVHETGPVSVEVEGDGAAAASVAFMREIGRGSEGRRSTITLRFTLEAASPVVRVEAKVDWQDRQSLLKLAFPTAYRGTSARYGAPFGSTLRPQLPGPLATDAMFEVPGSRWAAVADDTERDGLMVITEARYGFGCRSGLLHVSLLRSPVVTQPKVLPELTQLDAAASFQGLEVSDLGDHTIRLAFGRFSGDAPREETPAVLADTLFTQPLPYTGQPLDAGLESIDGGDSLAPAWVKPLRDGAWLLRLHETLGRRGHATLRLADGHQAGRCDARGSATENLTQAPVVVFQPYELVHLRVEPG